MCQFDAELLYFLEEEDDQTSQLLRSILLQVCYLHDAFQLSVTENVCIISLVQEAVSQLS